MSSIAQSHTHQRETHEGCSGESTHDHSVHNHSAFLFLRRFWIVTILLIPLVLVGDMTAGMLGIPPLPFGEWIGLGVATIIFYFSLIFFQHAAHEIKTRQFGMMTLVSLAVGVGYTFSVASTFVPALHAEFYVEISTLIWVLLFGHYLEAKSTGKASDALTDVAKLLPKDAHKIENGQECDVPVGDLKKNDVVRVKPGEKIPADGKIVEGRALVDESLVSGESKPLEKQRGDEVIAGSLCVDGSLLVELVRVGEHSTVGQIQKLIADAQKTKPRSQRVADVASFVLTLSAIVIALATLLVWTLVVGETFVFSITLAITVLVIACPHALGLAIPAVTAITQSRALREGIFIKDLSKIEVIQKADYVVFDKTGTLTKGEFGVTDVVGLGDVDARFVLKIAVSLEQLSSHMIGRAILSHAHEKRIEPFAKMTDFQNVPGRGIRAKINGTEYFVGNKKLIDDLGFVYHLPEDISGTMVLVAHKDGLLGYVVLSDAVKDTSIQAIEALHQMGVKVAMFTGDNEYVAEKVSKELAIDTYFAHVLPEEKFDKIRKLQNAGHVVLMVGDGVNDAPALHQADVGIAIGAGTDVAVEAGDVVLTDSDPQSVAKLIALSQKVYTKMIQNLVWALGYNVVALPLAAGVFAHSFFWGGIFLRPDIGALVMSLSTVIVVINALTLKNVSL